MVTRSAAIGYSDAIRVVPATFRDVLDLYRLERVCFPIDSWPFIDILLSLVLPRIVRLKATDGMRMVGFVVGDRAADAGWIASIGVSPEYRGRGVGAALLEAVEGAMDANAYRLCVRPSNTAAIRLYQRFGYEVVDTWKRYYKGGENALVMEKLPPARILSTPGM